MEEIVTFFGGDVEKDSCSVNLVASYSPPPVQVAPAMPAAPVSNPAQSLGGSK